MIVTLPDLLDPASLDSVRQALAGAPWQDGKSSAQREHNGGRVSSRRHQILKSS